MTASDTGAHAALPMFPLGTVLLPSMLLPLHIFEPRYRQLIADVGPNGHFGVVMIERGREVGGGDVRAAVGCIGELVAAEPLADGRWHIVVAGTQRISVLRWLDDDPYPRADVTVLDEPSALSPDDSAWASLEIAFWDVVDRIVARQGEKRPALELSRDPGVLTYQMAAIGPFGVLDRYRVLAAASPEARRDVLVDAIDGVATVLDSGA